MPEREKLKVSTRVMYDELVRQGSPVRIIDAESSMLEYEDSAREKHYLFSTSSDRTSAVGRIIANSKIRTEFIFNDLGLPTPTDIICRSYDEALDFLRTHKRIVLKPADNSGGAGVTTNITTKTALRSAYSYALLHGKRIIAQQHIAGIDLRLLIVAGKYRSAVERRPASVVGDGFHTIKELIEQENSSDLRASDYMTRLCPISLENSNRYLMQKINSVPQKDKVVSVVGPANISLGGTAHEATHLATAAMIADAEKIAQALGIDLCGVDAVWDQTNNQYFFLEINATPGIDIHNDTSWGTKSDAIVRYVEWLRDPSGSMLVYKKGSGEKALLV